jgi:hypothetical protein
LTQLNLQPEQLAKIRERAKVEEGHPYVFLGCSLNLETGDFKDLICEDRSLSEWAVQILSVLLFHYSLANPASKTGKLVKFNDLPGGYAYERAFNQRAVQPIAAVFGENPAGLVEAAKSLGGKPLYLGDASVEIPALEGIPLTYIVWKTDEFPASASVLFDESASCFLPTEDLAGLGELTTLQLTEAYSALKNEK